MEKIKDFIGFISSVLGIISFVYSVFCLKDVKSNVISFFIGIFLTLLFLYISIQIKRIPRYTEIDGMRIEEADSIPLFVSRKNILNPLNITHICEVEGTNAISDFDYYGVCCGKSGADRFSTSSYSYDITEIEEMEWYAFDLKVDPERKHKLKPRLKTPRGASSRVDFQFLKRVKYNTVFHFYTHQKLKDVIRLTGKDYYVSTVLYKNRPINKYQVILKFHDKPVKSLSVYRVDRRIAQFVYKLTDYTQIGNIYQYMDDIQEECAWSIRVYIFER